MAYQNIPVDPSQPDQEFSLAMDGVVFVLRLTLNSRTNRWTLAIKQEDGTLLIAGIPIIINYPLLESHRFEGMPAGDIFCLSESGDQTEPRDTESLGVTHSLLYREVGTIDE